MFTAQVLAESRSWKRFGNSRSHCDSDGMISDDCMVYRFPMRRVPDEVAPRPCCGSRPNLRVMFFADGWLPKCRDLEAVGTMRKWHDCETVLLICVVTNDQFSRPRAYVAEAALATCASNLSDVIVAMTPKLPFLPPDLLAACTTYVRSPSFSRCGPRALASPRLEHP